MVTALKNIVDYRELIGILAWKGIVLRFKQAYLGLMWSIAKPVMMMLIFTLMRSFIGIDSGSVPYPVLAMCALAPWMFFQEAVSDGVNSVVSNAHLIKKIYVPREVIPVAHLLTKLFEFAVNLGILFALMAAFRMVPTAQAVWLPLLVMYLVVAALAVALAGAALNVYYRDVGQMLPVLLSLLMYASPVIYPLHLVQQKLLVQRAAGEWSELLYTVFTANPLAGIIDACQRVLLKGLPPDPQAMLPGVIVVAVLLPISYSFFKRAEADFADVI